MWLMVAFVACSSLAIPKLAGQESLQNKSVAGETEQADPETATEDEIRKLISQLEAVRLADRDAAEKRLTELGAGILSHLPEINSRTGGELKIRLQRIRAALQTEKLDDFYEASRVSLTGQFPLSTVLKEIEQQTGNKITLSSQDNSLSSKMIQLNLKDVEFWQALDEIAAQAKLQVQPFAYNLDGLVLTTSTRTNSPPAFTRGPFRVETLSVSSTRAFSSSAPGQTEISVVAIWEPRLKPVYMQIPMGKIVAKTDTDQELASASPMANPEIPLNTGGCATQLDLPIALPSSEAQALVKLSGEFEVAVPSERHEYVFKNFANGARQSEKFGDVTVTLEGARRNGPVFEMRILVEFGNAVGALESYRSWILSNHTFLRGPNERILENVGFNLYANSSSGVGINYLFQINGDPDDFQLIYDSPAMMSRQNLAFELLDIPLP